TTFLYAPGAEGKTIEVVMTKPNREGSGADPYLILTLKNARMSNYTMTGTNGSLPSESFALTYTEISKAYYIEG
ncbi:type VI secretion system tube protein Hcp, partial [Vibrio mediterranei]